MAKYSDLFRIFRPTYGPELNACQSQNLHAPMTWKLRLQTTSSKKKDLGPLNSFIRSLSCSFSCQFNLIMHKRQVLICIWNLTTCNFEFVCLFIVKIFTDFWSGLAIIGNYWTLVFFQFHVDFGHAVVHNEKNMRIFQFVIQHRPLFYSNPLFDFQKSEHTQVWSVKSQGNSIIPSLSIESQSKKSSQHITKRLIRMSLHVSNFNNKFRISVG